MAARMQVDPSAADAVENEDEIATERGMKDDEILTIVRQEISNAAGALTNSKLSENRRSALRYYMGDAYGDEVEGRSQVVTTEFRDTIESLLPQLMKIFMSSDTVVQFIPNLPEEEKGSQQATDYINHVFMQENKGFLVLYTMMKDALMYKNGVVKIYWDEVLKTTTETYTGLSEMERNALLQDEVVEPIAYTSYEEQISPSMQPDGLMAPLQSMTLCDLTLRRTEKVGMARVISVPPEEFLITQRASGIQASRFVAHRCRKTASELVELGVEKDKAESLAGNQGEGEFSLERQQRFVYDGDTAPLSDSADPAVRYVWVTECYVLLDTDGDGIAEKWKVTVAGDQAELLFKEEWEGDWPFESISPILMQHKFYGLSMYDIVQQWQKIQSTLTRQFLDNIYSINNNRIAVNADRVNLDDLLTNRPNALVRTIGNPAEVLMPMQPSPLGAVLIPSMEYFNAQREKATGVTSYNQGLDADSLNKTASGISQIMGAAQERILLIARIFAETGISGMFSQLLTLVCKHQDKAKTIRLRGKWETVDPKQWAAGWAAVTDVALGTNNRDQMLLHLTQVLSIQQQAMQSGLPLVNPKNMYNTLVKLVENTGLKHPEGYFTDPDTTQPLPPKPSPEELLMQGQMEIEKVKGQATVAKTQMELQAEGQQKMAALAVETQRSQRESADRGAERELKLRIAREGNLTTLVTANMGADAKSAQVESKEKTKRKPQRLQVDRDPVTMEITGITPIYEEIKDTAVPDTEVSPEAQMMKGLLNHE